MFQYNSEMRELEEKLEKMREEMKKPDCQCKNARHHKINIEDKFNCSIRAELGEKYCRWCNEGCIKHGLG